MINIFERLMIKIYVHVNFYVVLSIHFIMYCRTKKLYFSCVFTPFRKFRAKPTTLTLVNICITLAASYFFFIVGVGRAENKQACDAMAFLLQYFILTSLLWMSVNAYQMYRAFVQVISVATMI